MITNVSLATVFVRDDAAAKAFYTQTLGFAENTDITLGEGYRWCTINHPNQPELQIQLSPPGPPIPEEMVDMIYRAMEAGTMFGLGLRVDDCRRTYEELLAKDVQFLQPPEERPYGVEAVARDNSGNWMVLIEPRDFSPDDVA